MDGSNPEIDQTDTGTESTNGNVTPESTVNPQTNTEGDQKLRRTPGGTSTNWTQGAKIPGVGNMIRRGHD